MFDRPWDRTWLSSGWQKHTVWYFSILFATSALVWALPQYATSRDVLQSPSLRHWLGTNDIGQDVLVGLLTATPNTLLIAPSAAFLSMAVSIAIAFFAAICGGTVSATVLRIIDILQTIPSILILLLVSAWLQVNFLGIILLMALTTWHDDVRVLYAVVLRELTRENVHYARRQGASWRYCIVRHILPAAWPVVVSLYIQHIRQSALKVAGLGFLGLTDPRLVTWGSMMQNALDYLYTPAWLWLLLPPAASLTAFLFVALNTGEKLERLTTAEAS